MEQEISLREIIEIVLKGKWVIIVVTGVVVLLVAILNFFVLSPVYESNSMVRIAESGKEGVKPIEMNSFIETVKSDAAINRLIEKLNLDPAVHTINSLKEQISTEVIKEINVMKIKVSGSDALLNTNIANFLAYELGNRVDSTARSRSIVEDQRKLKDLSDEVESTKKQLEEAKSQLAVIPEKQKTTQAISENPLLTVVAQRGGEATRDFLGLQLESETVNPAYTAVQTQIANISISLTKLVTEEANINKRIQENTDKINALGNQIQQEKLTARVSDRLLGGEQAIFVSPALEPLSPVGPNKILNMAIAAVLGGMVSVLYVFLSNYMRNSSKQ
jgi:Capsular polysaccharide biosynthesis protein